MSEDDDGDNSSSSSETDHEPLDPPVTSSSSAGKHIYFDDDEDADQPKDSISAKIIERETPSTVRVDGSDLINRCKDFLPLLSDPNQPQASIEEDDPIEIPSDNSSKESGEASSTTDDEKSTEIIKKKRKKKKKKKKKKLKTDAEILVHNNEDLSVQK